MIVGDGEERGDLEKQARRLKLQRIEFAGYQYDVTPFYRRATFVCLTSNFEGLPMMPGWRESRGAVLEFMQARRNEMQIYEDIPRKLQNGIIKWDGGRCGKEPGDVKRD